MTTITIRVKWQMAEVGQFKPITITELPNIELEVPIDFVSGWNEDREPILTLDGARWCYNQLEQITQQLTEDKTNNEDDEFDEDDDW